MLFIYTATAECFVALCNAVSLHSVLCNFVEVFSLSPALSLPNKFVHNDDYIFI